jgi:hypothetical protein
MGSEPSKELLDKRFIIIALYNFKHELELAHNSFKLNNKLNNSGMSLQERRLAYASYLKTLYEKLVLSDLKEVYDRVHDSPVYHKFHKEEKGIRICVTKGDIEVEQFINYSPYYSHEKYDEDQSIQCPKSLASYVQFR